MTQPSDPSPPIQKSKRTPVRTMSSSQAPDVRARRQSHPELKGLFDDYQRTGGAQHTTVYRPRGMEVSEETEGLEAMISPKLRHVGLPEQEGKGNGKEKEQEADEDTPVWMKSGPGFGFF